MITAPELIWSGAIGALAGALMALLTTLLNNRGQSRRQGHQLTHDIEQRTRQLDHDIEQRRAEFSHDAEQRRLDREMTLKRDVYLEATAAIGKLQEFIGSYGRQDLSEGDKLRGVQGSAASLNRVHIVGTNRTIQAFSGAQLAFVRCNKRLGLTKFQLVRKKIDLDQLQRRMSELKDRRQALLELRTKIVATDEARALEEMRLQARCIDVEIEAASSSLGEAQEDAFELETTLLVESVSCSIDMSRAFSAVALAIREELQFNLDVNAYRTFLEAHQEELAGELNAFLSDVYEQAAGKKPRRPQ